MTAITLPERPDFLNISSTKKIIIIGNGPSAIGQGLGDRIEAFDHIVRINNYVTRGLESEVGSRTDIWVNGANQGLKQRADLPKNILVMIPPVVLQHKGPAIHDRIRRRLGTQDYFMLPLETMLDLETTCGLERPTTGFFTIYFYYRMGLNITLHGFDFFTGSTHHYFDSSLKRWLKTKGIIKKAAKHDVSGEKAYVESLIASGRLKLLTA